MLWEPIIYEFWFMAWCKCHLVKQNLRPETFLSHGEASLYPCYECCGAFRLVQNSFLDSKVPKTNDWLSFVAVTLTMLHSDA